MPVEIKILRGVSLDGSIQKRFYFGELQTMFVELPSDRPLATFRGLRHFKIYIFRAR